VADLIETQEELFDASDINDEAQEIDQPQQEEVVQSTSEEDVPTKYRGKTASEIARMHMEAEKLIGRQAQEVGEVRKLADELIKRQLEAKQPQVQATKEDEIDYFEDPHRAVTKAIDTHPAIAEARQQAQQLKQMQTLNRLKEEFPDFMQSVQDPDFAEWVKASNVRVRLYALADSEGDYDAAAELLNNWKYVKPKSAQAPVASMDVKAAQKAAVKAATVDVGSNAATPTTSKIYRRADLIRLQLENPDRYYELQDEILAAYSEGRVR
jgi:hypothetical protein